MNESTLTSLKLIVERVVRPVRASLFRKRTLREELLAHVLGVFEEESAKVGDERAALERTALRFGNPGDVTSQLQATVPVRDALRRFWEGRPGESTLRTDLRLTWVAGVLTLVLLLAALFAGSWVSVWPREALLWCVGSALAVPLYLFGLALLTDWTGTAFYGPAGRSWRKVALVTAGAWLFLLSGITTLTWHSWPVDGDYRSAALYAGWLTVLTPCFLYTLARSYTLRRHAYEERRRYLEEWARLPFEPAA